MPERSARMRHWRCWLGGWWLCTALAHAATTVTDDRGQVLTFTQVPQRIVTLMPSLAESVCVLGACDRLVGTDRYANWPDLVKTVPKLGGLDDVQLEALVRLKPDLVVLGQSARIIPKLTALRIPVLVLEPQTQLDVQRSLQVLAQVLGVPEPEQRAAAIWRDVQNQVQSARQQMPASVVGASIYVEASTGGYAAGEASFMGELLTDLGLRNIVPRRMGAFPQLNPEFVVKAQPQWVVLAEPSALALHRRPGWSSVPALQRGQVCALPPERSDVLVRPGPRLGEAAQWLLSCFKPK